MNSNFLLICAWKRFCAGESASRGLVVVRVLSLTVSEELVSRGAAGVGVESLFMLAGAHRWIGNAGAISSLTWLVYDAKHRRENDINRGNRK
jgi:hypothetical protein